MTCIGINKYGQIGHTAYLHLMYLSISCFAKIGEIIEKLHQAMLEFVKTILEISSVLEAKVY